MPSETGDSKRTGETCQPPDAAWLVTLGTQAQIDRFAISVDRGSSDACYIRAGDALLVVADEKEGLAVRAFARVYRSRQVLHKTTLFADRWLQVVPSKPIGNLQISLPASGAAISSLDWDTMETALKVISGLDFSALPVVGGQTPQEQAYIRDLLQYAVVDDLLGPADGPEEEIVGMSVRDRYLVGKLAPPQTQVSTDQVDDLPDAVTADPDGTDREPEASTSQSLVPSSLGFTFCVDASVTSIELHATWGRYERTRSERIDEKTGRALPCWKRIPSGGTEVVSLEKETIDPIDLDHDCPDVVVEGAVGAPLDNGDRLVTLFLVNKQPKPETNQDKAWVFQPELIVRDPQGRAAFRRRPVLAADGSDEEREALEMIYRHRVEFAVGHGVSVHVTLSDDDSEKAVEVRTSVLPTQDISVTETPGLETGDRPAMRRLLIEDSLDMARLAEMNRDDLVSTLRALTQDYAAWIVEQRKRIDTDVYGFDASATTALGRCEAILGRLHEGVSVLESDDVALDAFRFANRAMALQRIHSIYSLAISRGEKLELASLDQAKNRTWRPFQLAFILLSIPALSDPTHRDRTEPVEAYADLLWFPTGGGKTEAYLGVAAFAMAIRRLQGGLGGLDGRRGLAVIMRYTLRLLTIQQFQRAATLMCAMEVLRREDTAKWGSEAFTLGLWVGQRVTPNKTEESHEAIERERKGRNGSGSTPAQLTFCPWCGAEIVPGRHIRVDRDTGRTHIYCGDKYSRCEFSNSKPQAAGLPVLTVDEEIYHHPPSMLIATVDKFAMMAWRGEIRTLFGKVNQECPRHGLLWPDADCKGTHHKRLSLSATSPRRIQPLRPPDLIIQDEFHLIGGPLGTMVGLYETAVDELSSWELDGKTVRPKIIASTATVRKADEQVNNVFLRRVAIFPPHGIDVEDNFFSVQRPPTAKPGRRYMGICSPGSSRPAVLIRVYVALLTAAQSLFDNFGRAADPYMTLIGYFNSLRELGGMRRLAEDDVQTRCFRVQMSDVARPGLSQRSVRNVDELTSRVSNRDIRKKLDRLLVRSKSSYEKGEARAFDIVLATNMLSVGVDVNRLGLMVVNGQPKNTAEYIQATSRVGRAHPGMVCTVLTWSRPRDLSHYETFEHYHATFYKHVEAQSVTPFAPRALDRGLTGAMVSALRLENDSLNPNLGAQELADSTRPQAAGARKTLSDRAWKVKGKTAGELVDTMVADRIDRWVKEATRPGRRLGYESRSRQGDVVALLRKPGVTAWDEFTVPFSMREVEPGVRLAMDDVKLDAPPPWQPRIAPTDSEEGEA